MQEILGVHLAPDGNHYQQVRIHWTNCMLTGCIPKDDAWLAFQSTIWKSMSYPLPALNITKEDCEKTMTPILRYLLPAIGVCRKFLRTLV